LCFFGTAWSHFLNVKDLDLIQRATLFIAFRYLFSKNKSQAIHILSLITMVAMAVGAAALIIILSTFNGFEHISTSLNESFQPDLTIVPVRNKQFEISDESIAKLSQSRYITAISKILEEKVYVKYQDGEALASIKGVDKNYFKTNTIADYIVAGDTILENDQYSFAVLGAGIASNLNINFDNQFETLSIYYPKSENTGGIASNYEVNYLIPGGAFSIFQEYDEKYIIAPLEFVQYLNGSEESRVSALEVKVKPNSENEARKDIQAALGSEFLIKNKLELNQTFYKISRIEKMMTFLILTFVLIILSFNFIGSLAMHTIDKAADIRTLYHLGMKPDDIFKLYLSLGVMQGLIGGIIGLIIGIGICILQQTFGLVGMPGSGTFVINAYPVDIQATDILLIFGILIMVSFFASIFPASQARKSVLRSI
jgi:ABC-type lipoprotein release transport system permease subunit